MATNTAIWNLIGEKICKYYREKEKIDIYFLEADKNNKRETSLCDTNYILLLDNSTSMKTLEQNGLSKWNNLKNAVSEFIKKLMADQQILTHSSISIITYS